MIRNFLYIKRNLNRPQYQLSVYWLKFYLREFLTNFNIVPCGDEKYRPLFFTKMINSINSFKILYSKWMSVENERRLKICNFKNLTRKNKLIFKPVEKNFLKNFKLLTSKYIYSQFLLNFKNIPKLSYAYSSQEEKEIFYNLHRYNTFSNIPCE